MNFTGRNLVLILWGLNDAMSEIHNQIAICPDIFEYHEEITEFKEQLQEYEKLRDRVQAACIKQGLIEKE